MFGERRRGGGGGGICAFYMAVLSLCVQGVLLLAQRRAFTTAIPARLSLTAKKWHTLRITYQLMTSSYWRILNHITFSSRLWLIVLRLAARKSRSRTKNRQRTSHIILDTKTARSAPTPSATTSGNQHPTHCLFPAYTSPLLPSLPNAQILIGDLDRACQKSSHATNN